MKRFISLAVVFALLCTMAVVPVAFADETSDNAYDWMDISKLPSGTSSGSRNYGSYIQSPSSSDKTSGRFDINGNRYFDSANAALDASVAVRLGGSQYFVFGNVDFGTVVPTSVVLNILIGDVSKKSSDPLNTDTTIRFYAFPVGTKIAAVSNGVVTDYTIPGADKASDATSYLIGEWQRYGGKYNPQAYDVENGAVGGLWSHEYKLDTAKAAGLIKEDQTSNPWMIVICGSDTQPAYNGFVFNSGKYDAFSTQSVYYNADCYNIGTFNEKGTVGLNNALKTGETADDYEASITYENVDFGNKAERDLAVVVNYASGSSQRVGDIKVEIDMNDNGIFEASERYATIRTVKVNTDAASTSRRPTAHYALLSDNVTGTHDVRFNFLEPNIARVLNVRFAEVNPEMDIYGDVTAVDKGDGTYTVSVPINKNYIKGLNKYIVALYNTNSEGNPTTLHKIAEPVDFTVATKDSNDYGWDNSEHAIINLPKADVEGKYIKAFLWRDFEDIVPLVPASVTMVTAE